MSAQIRIPRMFSRASAVSALTVAAVGGTVATPGYPPEAEAATVAAKALRIAASKKGAPYRYGAAGPKRFDCSGLTQYAYKRAGKRLPRTAAAQYNGTRHIKAASRKSGDLVFFHSGSGVYHVGVYAGSGRIWHAPKTGTVVRLERIWTKKVWYGHVR
ncbi:C40 family peptidase [Streptomyces samsunensis]|uniref:C40 family peptidase n=4 Tax=Streptomyces TaxID=1883 RepID=A0ABX6WES2_STRMQ|nr:MULTISPECIES: C40 family peptidase [Streptomyces]AQA15340.1 glycoside hydrolase [Streptomyces autolyticus]AUA09707.1 putative endopeptidase p60 precursor [Streptomyces sp. M56]MCC4322583.1 C40 family peptidase [Streptomyces malaysiensis]MCD9595111.1 C40 family peptidase [Streptomyces sp. 8ZJF_21]MCM3811730.1 C40 family peptidase [Streptomyces sp. DR7-3]